MPQAGMVLSQQSGRRRAKLVVLPLSACHMVTLLSLKKRAWSVAA